MFWRKRKSLLLHSPAEMRSKTEICRLKVTVSGIGAGAIQESALVQTEDLIQTDMEKILNQFDKFILKAPYLASARKVKLAVQTMFNFGKKSAMELELERMEAKRTYLNGLERLCDKLSAEYPKFSFDLHQDEDPIVYFVAICMFNYESFTIERALVDQLGSQLHPEVSKLEKRSSIASSGISSQQQPPRRSSMMSSGFAPRRVLSAAPVRNDRRISVMSSQSSVYTQIYTIDEDLSKEKNKFTFDRVPLAMQIPNQPVPKVYQHQGKIEEKEVVFNQEVVSNADNFTVDRVPLAMQIPNQQLPQSLAAPRADVSVIDTNQAKNEAHQDIGDFTIDRVPLAMQIPKHSNRKSQIMEVKITSPQTFENSEDVMSCPPTPPMEVQQLKSSSGYQTPDTESEQSIMVLQQSPKVVKQNQTPDSDLESHFPSPMQKIKGLSENHIAILQKLGLERQKAIEILAISKQDLEIACGFAMMASQ